MLMFSEKSFDVFTIEGLEQRMTAIREEIQPIFKELDNYFKEQLEQEIGEELFVHIAQHRRRTVYPPENTWSALSQKKRGYKMEPHFQLGIWPDYIFMWLSFIDNPKNEQLLATTMLENSSLFASLTDDFYLSLDHTRPTIEPVTEDALQQGLTRFRNVKKGEFQIGRVIQRDAQLLQSPAQARSYMLDTYQQLLPIYTQVQPLMD